MLTALVVGFGAAWTSELPKNCEATAVVDKVRYRVQALSENLVRVEAEGPRGEFEDRATFFAQNRKFPGVEITSTSTKGNTTLVCTTSKFIIELSPSQATPPATTSDFATTFSSCRNPLAATAVSEKFCADQSAAANSTSTADCCAACDRTVGCTAWSFTPGSTTKPSGAKFSARKCDKGKPGQAWTFIDDGAWTTVKSAAPGSGCWEVNACSTADNAAIGTNFGCKALPKPKPWKSNCDANMAWAFFNANNSIVSVMDGKCLTLGSGNVPVVRTCKPGSKEQQFHWDVKQSKDGKTTSTIRPAAASATPLCLDDTQENPAPIVVLPNCSLLSSMAGIKDGGATVIGGAHPGSSFHKGSGCAVTIRSTATATATATVAATDGDSSAAAAAAAGPLLWFSPSFGTVPAQLSFPPPSLVQAGYGASAVAILDAPRFVPPPRGAIPPSAWPAGTYPHSLLPFANTSGYDVNNHALDLYVILSAAPSSEASAVHSDRDQTSETEQHAQQQHAQQQHAQQQHAQQQHAQQQQQQAAQSMRQTFLELTGPVPVLPSWSFGFWFCWYHPYNQSEKTAEIQRFLDDDLALEVASSDRGWRDYLPLNSVAAFNYTVNTTLWPDVDGLFKFVHDQGLKIFFNDHPKPLNVSKGGSGSSDALVVLNPREIKFRFDGLTSLLKRGLDFWWYDCHWAWFEPSLRIPGASDQVDGNTWGQSVFHDVMWASAQQQEALSPKNGVPQYKPFGLGCSGSSHPAAHRYPTHWTGDIFSQDLGHSVTQMVRAGYESLMPYVHPDCTAHHNADPPEVYVRWVQFCSLGNIMRVHSDPYNDRRPWAYGAAVEATFRRFAKMRVDLAPALASAAVQASIDGTPLVARLDFEWPDSQYAEHGGSSREDQYLLARDTLIAPLDPFAANATALATQPPTALGPVTGPPKNTSWNRRRTVWVPPGEWTDGFTGNTVTGPRTLRLSLDGEPLERMPLYHRRGGLMVSATMPSKRKNATDTAEDGSRSHEHEYVGRVSELDWGRLVLHVWPHSHGFVQRSAAGSADSTRVFYDSTSRAPAIWRTVLRMGHRYPSLNQGLQQQQQQEAQRTREVVVTIGGETLNEFDTLHNVPNASIENSHKRSWLLRVHLVENERVVDAATSTGVPLQVMTIKQSKLPGQRHMPFGRQQQPPVAGPRNLAMEIAEISLEKQEANVPQHIRLKISH